MSIHEMQMMTGQHWIAGQPSRDGTAVAFTSINPYTRAAGAVTYVDATPNEIDRAVQAARTAFTQTLDLPPAGRAALLEAIARQIDALGDDLLTTADAETGLGIPRLTGERGRTTGQLRVFAALVREGSHVNAILDTAQPNRQPAPRPDIRRMDHPLGVVSVFSASNFPFAFAVAGGDSASAWAAGCPVIVKGHPGHPATSDLFARAVYAALDECDLPPGLFSLVQGAGTAVGVALVTHPGVDAVGFTGSLRGGRALYDLAAARPRPIPVYAEMGSVNPLIVLPGALGARGAAIAEGLAGSVTLGAGQFCTKPGLIFVIESPAAAAFITNFTGALAARAPAVLLNPAIQRGLADAVQSTTALDGVSIALGGGSPPAEGAICYPHTVLTTMGGVFLGQPDALQREHFGGAALVVTCADAAELTACAAALHGSLTASLHADPDDHALAADLYAILTDKAGRLLYNGFPTGVEVVYAQMHGGPYPAATPPAATSVGLTALHRWTRPVAYQNWPDALLPAAVQDANPLGILRIVDGQYTRDAVTQ